MRFARRLIAVLLAAAVVAPTAAARTDTGGALEQKLARALTVPHVSRSLTAAVAYDLASGRVVFAHNASRALAPASTEKLPLTYALLTALGPSYRIETDVLASGGQEGSTWHGDLVLQGHGDPTLSRGALRRLALQIRALGVRRVVGSIVADETWFDARRTAPGWKPSYYVNESPPLSALTVDRARYRGVVSRDPALAAALLFHEALRAAGVTVSGSVAKGSAEEYLMPLAHVVSPPLASIVRFMNRESDNFTAEILLKHLGAVILHKGTTAAGAAVVRRQLGAGGIPLAGVRIVDGSGLSRLDRLTANALVALLASAWLNPEIRPALVGALPVAGVSGTLVDRMRRAPARGNVFAKTGTTQEASALSGFVRGRYAFAVLQNGRPVSSWWARVAQDRFATILAAQ